jgi:diacylglycerol kinase (ATP)
MSARSVGLMVDAIPFEATSGAIPVIVNPAAQSFRAARKVQRVRHLSRQIQLHETRATGDARQFARELAESGVPVIVAAGGDGTINEVIAGLIEAKVASMPALGLLPLGTMNVLACELRLPTLNLQQCWNLITEGRTREIDLWLAGGLVFAQMAGIGLDAAVIEQTSPQSKRRWGPLSYVGTLFQLLDQPVPEVQVSLDGGPPISGTTVLLGNGRLYGGPFQVFPRAANDDGWLEVAIIHGHGPALFAGLVADVLTRRQDTGEMVTRQRARSLRIHAPCRVPFEIDGELGGETPLLVERHPQRLRVIV